PRDDAVSDRMEHSPRGGAPPRSAPPRHRPLSSPPRREGRCAGRLPPGSPPHSSRIPPHPTPTPGGRGGDPALRTGDGARPLDVPAASAEPVVSDRPAEGRKTLIFIAGYRRSGTTALQDQIAAHPDIRYLSGITRNEFHLFDLF